MNRSWLIIGFSSFILLVLAFSFFNVNASFANQKPQVKKSQVIRSFQIDANCREQDDYIGTYSDGTHPKDIFKLKSCIYLTNNKFWIHAVASWNYIPCNDYQLGESYSSIVDNNILFNVRDDSFRRIDGKKGLTIYWNDVNTCGVAGHTTWDSPVINGHKYHTYVFYQPNYGEHNPDNSPSVIGYTRASKR